ncbi:MFS transporter [Streptomyces sp. IB2014 016-6]|uniref:MFS transporter n=1 Tax=Streptomyces sp. IB2014 016-6 TaxID=2517818 RepID=UPI0011CC16C9|nr:MFS transporter [Streptomyces sp. IB2014 016-6]TXL90020.1 DHA2 family efflux MFS transporter permease subunit [Streptomyces sp. IB2014 016-6]
MPENEPDDSHLSRATGASGAGPHGHGRGEPRARHAPTALNKWWTLTAVCLGTFMLLLDITIVNVALPDIQRSLHASFSDLQWVVDAYSLTLASLLLTAGSLADMYGRKKLYVIGLTIFSLASLLCGLADSGLMLQLSRGIQGVGGSIMFSVSLALLADAFRGKDRGVAFGIWGTITGLAVAIGPLLGGVLTTGLSWEWIFYVNLPIGAIAVAITLVKVAESRQPGARHPDWPGFVLFTAALSSLVYALIQSSHDSFSDPVVIACLTAAFVLMIAFVVVELRTAQAMFDLSLFRKPTFTGGLVAAFGLSASILSMLLYLVLYLQDVLGYSALGAGMRLLLISAGILVVSTISGRLSSRMPVRFLIGPGLLLIGGGLLWMRGLNSSSDWTHLIPGMIMSGAGLGLVNPPLASTAVGVVQPAHAGMASGINSTFRQIGIATGIALLGTLFSSKIKSYVTDHIGAIPGVGDFGPQISTAVQSGTVAQALGSLPPEVRAPVKDLATAAFTSGLNEILLVAALIALVAGVVSLATIRTKDFVQAPS